MANVEKVMKALGEETVNEMNALDKEALKATIVSANQAMEQVQKELDENEEFQALLESKKAMEAGKKEVNKRQKAKIAYACMLLGEKGE